MTEGLISFNGSINKYAAKGVTGIIVPVIGRSCLVLYDFSFISSFIPTSRVECVTRRFCSLTDLCFRFNGHREEVFSLRILQLPKTKLSDYTNLSSL